MSKDRTDMFSYCLTKTEADKSDLIRNRLQIKSGMKLNRNTVLEGILRQAIDTIYTEMFGGRE